MPAPTNAITSADIQYGLTQEFVANFNQDVNQLMSLMGIIAPEPVGAGYTLQQHKVTGSLSNQGKAATNAATEGTSGSGYVEGDLVALSKYAVTSTTVEKAKIRPYRKLTTAQAIAEHGMEWAVVRTDAKMQADVRDDIMAEFFSFLGNGTGTAKGKDLQAALAYGDAKLGDALEGNHDKPVSTLHFVNRTDIADYLSHATVTTQTAFGLTYIENFLGIQNIFVTSKVAPKTVYVTDAANLHVYAQDFSELARAGLSYEVGDSGLIGVNHNSLYDHVSVETNVLTGMVLFPEVTDYVVKSTVSAS